MARADGARDLDLPLAKLRVDIIAVTATMEAILAFAVVRAAGMVNSSRIGVVMRVQLRVYQKLKY